MEAEVGWPHGAAWCIRREVELPLSVRRKLLPPTEIKVLVGEHVVRAVPSRLLLRLFASTHGRG